MLNFAQTATINFDWAVRFIDAQLSLRKSNFPEKIIKQTT